MSAFEGISLVLSVIAIIISIVVYLKATALSLASIELTINERITATKERVSDISLQMASLLSKKNRNKEEDSQLHIYQLGFKTAVENNLNAYEEACSKYLDWKVDRNRFEKTYKIEIRQLVENHDFKDYFDGVTSRYRAILKVYTKWENLEK